MTNYKQLTINLLISNFFLLFSLASASATTVENISTDRNSTQSLSEHNSSLHARRLSRGEVEKMRDELQQLVNRVESTLITVEAKRSSSSTPMSDVVKNIGKKKLKSRVSNGYSNSRAYNAIVNAKKLLADFPTLVQQDYNSARQKWLDARRDLWMSYPVNNHLAQPEIRAMWLDRGTIVKARSKKDLEPLFDRMARAGINTVFMETINASYPIYPSTVAPEQNPMTKGWDPLQASIELAHERGMELHAWLWAFAAANEGHNRVLGQPSYYLGPVLSRNPSWALKDQKGRIFNRTPGFKKAFFDPANPEVRRYLLSLVDEIVTKYDVDGIQLDYIRYPFQDNTTKQQFGYTDVSRNLFKQQYGVDPKTLNRSSSLWNTWTGFRVQQITSFVEQTSELIENKSPEVILSTAVFPMERNQRLNTLQQHWEDWGYNQSVDLVVLMTYALDTGKFEDRLEHIYKVAQENSNFVIPAIRLLNVPETEAFDQMQLIRNMPSGGYALFAAENFDTSLENIFLKTQGTIEDQKEPIPYREPFVTALSRYQNLQQEWIFLLENEQIKIDQSYLQLWSEQSDKLANNLQVLTQKPTPTNALKVQKQLSSFRNRLSRYSAQHRKTNSWQVESWMNRIMTIENMLRYGQTIVVDQNTESEDTSASKMKK